MMPRMVVTHTSETQSGQIYMPQINTMLMLGVLVLVLGFGSSSALSNAYGIAVSGVMIVTLSLLVVVMWRNWKWHPAAVISFGIVFALIDGGFFAANAAKLFQGGWVPAVVAMVVALIMWSWMAGRRRLSEKTRRDEVPLQFLVDNLSKKKPTIVPGTAVFLTSTPDIAPTALMHNLKHNRVIHERNIILAIKTEDVPRVPRHERVKIEAVSDTFTRVIAHYGFMETPSVPKIFDHCRRKDLNIDIGGTSFFLSRRSLKPVRGKGLPIWQEGLFMSMAASAEDATTYFGIPSDRVVEIGTQVEI